MVHDIINKEKEGDSRYRAKVPKHQSRRTPMAIEDRAIEVKNRTRLGPDISSRHLKSMKASRFPRGQFAILSGKTRRGLITICAT